MSVTIGIDLGTTNCVVAVIEGGQPTVIPSAEGGRTIPSVVAFRDNEILVGTFAKRQAVTNPASTISSAKRLMGRRFDDDLLVDAAAKLGYTVVASEDNAGVAIRIPDGRTFAPQEIAALLLAKVRKDAERYLGTAVDGAVVTVPAYFNDAQRQATAEAAKVAGLDVQRIINEPTAAALSYGLARGRDGSSILVYDFGGGTFDVSVLQLHDGVLEVLATSGDTRLGGDDLDARVIEWIRDRFEEANAMPFPADPMALQRVRDAAEQARIELSATAEVPINLPFLTADAGGPRHLQTLLRRAEFEDLVEDIIELTRRPVADALEQADLTPDQIDDVVLCGGVTRTPMVMELVRDIFPRTDILHGINPDEAVALGAAVQSGLLSGDVRGLIVLDVTPLSLGIETIGDRMSVVVPRNTTIPTTKAQPYTTTEDGQSSIRIDVYQGESHTTRDNEYVAGFIFGPIDPAPAGVPSVEVRFDLDVNGMLHVKATDQRTGRQQGISIEASTRTGAQELEQMRRRLVEASK